jgi:hypothetical protein
MLSKYEEAWEKWVGVYHKLIEKGANAILDTISEVDPKYQILVAAAFSVAKWHPSNASVYRGRGGFSSCGLCCKFYMNRVLRYRCKGCPIVLKERKACVEFGSLYRNWCDSVNYGTLADRHAAANRMYKRLLSIYEEEYEKVDKRLIGGL